MTIVAEAVEAPPSPDSAERGEEDAPLEIIESEVDDLELSLPSYDIRAYPADYTLEVLVDKWRKGQIVIPSFQRQFVWSQRQASKLIDSFLMGLPIPPVYLFLDRNSTSYDLLVVDGQQRIKSIVYFFDGVFGEERRQKRRVFRLTGLAEESKYKGLTYEDLESQYPTAFARLNNSLLRSIITEQINPADKTSLYHIFERLNTGGTPLRPQEIRNCIHHGSFMDRLIEVNKYKPWRAVFGKPKPDTRQRDVELIIRFLALHDNLENYRKPMKSFLNSFTSDHSDADNDQLWRFESLFRKTVDAVIEHLGERPFHISSGLNVAVFDSVFVTIAQLETIPEDLEEKYQKLIRDSKFLECIRARTTDDKVVLRRLELARQALE